LLAALAKPVIGVAAARPTVLGARSFDRVGAGLRSAPRDALLASSVSKEHRGKAFGLEGFGDNLGAFLGPLLAVLLMTALAVEIRWIFCLGHEAVFVYGAVFAIVGAGALLVLVSAMLSVRTERMAAERFGVPSGSAEPGWRRRTSS